MAVGNNANEQLLVSAPAQALDGAITLITIPLCESLHIVEFGLLNTAGADNVASGVLKLQAIDSTAGGATFVDLCILTGTGSAPLQGSMIARRCDVQVDKVNATATGPGSSGNTNAVISPSAGKVFVGVQLRVTTAFTASAKGTGYVKIALCGSAGAAKSGVETLVIA